MWEWTRLISLGTPPPNQCSPTDIKCAPGHLEVSPQLVRLVLFVAQPLSFCLTPALSVIILVYVKCSLFPGRQEERVPAVPTPFPSRMSRVVSGSPVSILWGQKPGKPSQKLLFS